MILNLSLKNSQNVGDANCAPCQYFPIGGAHMDFREAQPKADTVIFGGGAVADRAASYRTNAVKILWGAGATIRYAHGPEHLRHNPKAFALYGCRDYGHGEWVPCASCMSPLFDDVPDPEQEIVYYGHHQFGPYELNNDCMDFAAVIEHMARGETIVTTSYHGMYWGLLLGRKVVAVPFGAKFYGLPWDVQLVREYTGQEGKAVPNALSEAREANLSFWEKVKAYVA